MQSNEVKKKLLQHLKQAAGVSTFFWLPKNDSSLLQDLEDLLAAEKQIIVPPEAVQKLQSLPEAFFAENFPSLHNPPKTSKTQILKETENQVRRTERNYIGLHKHPNFGKMPAETVDLAEKNKPTITSNLKSLLTTSISSAGSESDFSVWKEKIQNATDLNQLQTAISNCTQCGLCEGRTQIVFGQGNAKAEILFIGEGPGKTEDQQGIPFVGRAGKLLNQMILSLQLPREAIYIANIVKCRPPENRQPTLQEVEKCRPILKKQIELIQPKLIVALGATALKALLPDSEAISQARGKRYLFAKTPLIPTFHPAYLIRNRTKLNEAYQDYRFIYSVFQALKG